MVTEGADMPRTDEVAGEVVVADAVTDEHRAGWVLTPSPEPAEPVLYASDNLQNDSESTLPGLSSSFRAVVCTCGNKQQIDVPIRDNQSIGWACSACGVLNFRVGKNPPPKPPPAPTPLVYDEETDSYIPDPRYTTTATEAGEGE